MKLYNEINNPFLCSERMNYFKLVHDQMRCKSMRCVYEGLESAVSSTFRVVDTERLDGVMWHTRRNRCDPTTGDF